jgi:hypothetical protein
MLMAVVLVASAGLLRLPFERDMELEFKEQGFRDWSPGLSTRDQLTQAAFVGALGGFRSLVASAYHLKAHNSFVKKEWGDVERYRAVTVSLQPKFWRYWDMAVWDMAWNAYGYYRGEAEEYGDDFKGWHAENIIMPRYLEKGITFAKRGLEWLPEDYRLIKVIADIYDQKMSNPEKAAEWYLKASQKPQAPPHIYRAYAHQLTLCAGREKEAYRVTADLYRNSGDVTLTLLRDMERLEDGMARRAARDRPYDKLKGDAFAEDSGYLEMAAFAMHLLEIRKDVPAAISAYAKVAGNRRAASFYRRKLAFLMAEDPQKAAGAYVILKDLAVSDPGALRREDMAKLAQLESQLGIPEEDRIRP